MSDSLSASVRVAKYIPFVPDLGQIELLQHCLAVQGQEFDATVAKARADGFEVEEEDEEETSEEEEKE